MDGLKNALEAMAILEEPSDVLAITTLKTISPGSSNSNAQINSEDDREYFNNVISSPKQSGSIPDSNQKMVSRCSQTDEEKLYGINSNNQNEDFISDRRYINNTFGMEERSIYKSNNSSEKIGNSRAWDMVRETIGMVKGRKHNKERNRELLEEKKRHRNSSPTTFEQEQDDALAELDSVIESYHGKPGVLKRSRRRGMKESERNGGTWPKARNGPIIEHGTGTIIHPRRNKERLPLSVLLTNPPKYCWQPPPPSHDCNASCSPSSSSGYKTNDTEHHYSKSGQLIGTQKTFTPTPFKDLLHEKKERIRGPSDASIDLSVKSGNVGKEVMEYYVKKKKYPPSDNEDSHSRIHSQLYGALRSYTFTPYPLAHPHPHPHTDSATRYPSPTTLPSSQSGESIGISDTRSYCFETSYTSPSQVNKIYLC